MNFIHPADCKKCFGTLIEMISKREKNGYTIGVRYCSNLKPFEDTKMTREELLALSVPAPATPEGLCGEKHLLSGLTQDVYNAGGLPCILKHGHKGGCRVVVEQATQSVTMEIPLDPDEQPKIIATREKK